MLNKIIYNLDTYQIESQDIPQILNVGQDNSVEFAFYFKQGGVFVSNPLWQVYVVFVRADDEKSNLTLTNLNQDHYVKGIGSWFTDVEGIGKVQVHVKFDTYEPIKAFATFSIPINEGFAPSGDTITDEQYQELLINLNKKYDKTGGTITGDVIVEGDINAQQVHADIWTDKIQSDSGFIEMETDVINVKAFDSLNLESDSLDLHTVSGASVRLGGDAIIGSETGIAAMESKDNAVELNGDSFKFFKETAIDNVKNSDSVKGLVNKGYVDAIKDTADNNKLDINDINAELVRLDNVKIEQGALDGFVFQPTWDKNNHILTLNMQGYPPLVIDLPSEYAFHNIRVEGDNLILTREDGTEVVVSLSGLLNGMASEEWVRNNFYDKLESDVRYINKDNLVKYVEVEQNIIQPFPNSTEIREIIEDLDFQGQVVVHKKVKSNDIYNTLEIIYDSGNQELKYIYKRDFNTAKEIYKAINIADKIADFTVSVIWKKLFLKNVTKRINKDLDDEINRDLATEIGQTIVAEYNDCEVTVVRYGQYSYYIQKELFSDKLIYIMTNPQEVMANRSTATPIWITLSTLKTNGDGTKFLSDDGTYKEIQGVDLERANMRINELERQLREIGSDSEVINKNGYEIDLGANAIGNVKVDMLAGGKNLAIPNLTGKEYLGNGVYRIYNSNGITLDYNIYNGEYVMNGTSTINKGWVRFLTFNLPINNYTASLIYVSGDADKTDYWIGLTNNTNYTGAIMNTNQLNHTYTFTNEPIFSLRSLIGTGSIYNNLTFKVQLEKGSTATDYEAPYINATTLKRLSIQNSTINEASPDLTGKEYLGNGVYRHYDNKGITVDYDIYNGYFIINGTADSGINITIAAVSSNSYYASVYYVSGTFTSTETSDTISLYTTPYNVNNIIVFKYSNQNKLFSVPFTTLILQPREGQVFDNYQFKLQIEKGTTATPYVLPIFNENNIHSELFIKPKIQLQANDIITYNKGNFLLNDTILNTSGLLVAQPNTKLVIENITNEVNTYGKPLLYNIVSIKKLLKINQDGTETPIDLSTITINDNTFTTTQLNNNDLFYVVYEFETIESGLKAFASYYNSDKIVIDETTDKVYKWKVKINNGVPELIATEVE